MRALRVDQGRTALADVQSPVAGGEAVVRVVLSGVCNTDLEIARGYAGFRGTIGHEFVGVVEDPGGGPLVRGDRVVGEINAGCGACPRCLRGDPRHCPARTVLGIVGRDGAHAEQLRLPARNLLRVPDGVSDEQAVFAEPLAAARGVLGAASGFELALDLLEPQGTLVLKSTFHGATPVDAARVVVDEIRVVGSRCGRLAPALDLLARGVVAPAELVSEIMPLSMALDAMKTAAAPGVLKVLLRAG
jgi:threonine dehydrogenase-like Zn-dependent dehydrogenase